MSLSEIKNRLYKKQADDNLMSHDESEFDVRSESVGLENATAVATDDVWAEKETGLNEKRKGVLKILGISLGIVIGITLIMVAVYQIRKSSFNESRVIVSIDGPQEAKSGKLLTYEISYNNNNWGSLKNTAIRISHPESFKPEESVQYREESPTVSLIELGELKGHATGKIIFAGRAYTPKGTLMYIKADLVYTPSNFNSQFVANTQKGVNVTSTPITLAIMVPQNLASGDALNYQINYKNVGAEDFENIRLKVDYQDGFIFSKAAPLPSESDNVWYIGHLSAGEEGTIIVSGKLQGEEGNIKKTTAYIGVISQNKFISYNEESASTNIVASPLLIAQAVNGASELYVNAGENLNFEIRYKNNGDIGLGNIIVRETLDSPILDYTTLDMDGGSFNMDTKTIEWKSVDYPELRNLAPGQSGSIRFSIKVKDIIPMQTVNDKNFVIESIAKIDSPDIETPIEMNKIISGNKIDIKLKSKLLLDVTGYYTDSLVSNYGPIPPVVGQETSYAIHLKVGNVSNDIAGAKVEVVLPAGVVATGKKYPEDANLSYNERSSTLIWDIGNMQAGEGVLSLPREVVFQVKINPASNQVGEVIEIVKDVNFSAKDSFTDQILSVQSGSKNTMLQEDQTINALGWKVTQ